MEMQKYSIKYTTKDYKQETYNNRYIYKSIFNWKNLIHNKIQNVLIVM